MWPTNGQAAEPAIRQIPAGGHYGRTAAAGFAVSPSHGVSHMHAEATEGRHPHNEARRGERSAGEQQAGPIHLWVDPLEQWSCMLNIDRFRDQLTRAPDAAQRATLLSLLMEHETRLQRSAPAATPAVKANGA